MVFVNHSRTCKLWKEGRTKGASQTAEVLQDLHKNPRDLGAPFAGQHRSLCVLLQLCPGQRTPDKPRCPALVPAASLILLFPAVPQ